MSFSWESRSAAALTLRRGSWTRSLALRRPHPELALLVGLAGLLNLWALGRNGWANDYYSAAARSMSSSWHNFLFGSLDASGVMSVDKPPLALWVQSLSVRVFGYHPLSILVPQALIGIATVVLVYDLVRSRFGRLAGFIAGLVLALTPMTVAISRHNNPDALLVLCCVAALWCTVRALDAEPARVRTRWLALAGVAVGLGFETKMAVALLVVPGIVGAWLWIAPGGRLRALRSLLAAGVAMLLVGGAWPLLVELTPAADRPWISGTSDNRILSLIFEYNGVGRLDGQTGGPVGAGAGNVFGGAGNVFGGSAGPLRLLNSALGGQAGWLLGFALLSALGVLLPSRLRRADPRSGWLIAVGGSFLAGAVVFSAAKGIFHPYYVSLLAPFIAALTGAGASQLLRGGLQARIVGPLALLAGVVGELAVLSRYPEQLSWLAPILIAVGILAALALGAFAARRVRLIALAAGLAALLVAPTAWAVETLGYTTSATFPAGGPASVTAQGPGGPGAGPGARAAGPGGPGFGSGGPGFGSGGPRGTARPGAGGAGGAGSGNGSGSGPGPGPGPQLFGAGGAPGAPPGLAAAVGGVRPAGPGGGGGPGGGVSMNVLTYVEEHGGGTIAIASQSGAASAIVAEDAAVAGIGGFSGRESDVSVSWLVQEVSAGKIRWVLGEGTGAGGGFPGSPRGDTRTGSKTAITAAEKACAPVSVPASTSATASTLYDCRGRAGELARA